VDPVRRADMAFRVPKAKERLEELRGIGLWSPPEIVDEVLEAAERSPIPSRRQSSTETCTSTIS
jgi:hypothetical protein